MRGPDSLAPGLGRSDWKLASVLHDSQGSPYHSSATLPNAWEAQLRAGSNLPISQKGKRRLGEVHLYEGHNQERTQAGVCPHHYPPLGSKPLFVTFWTSPSWNTS